MTIPRTFKEDSNIEYISGKQFVDSGALWYVNTMLHTLGLVLVYNPDDDTLAPAITKYRGFPESVNNMGYKRLTKYMNEQSAALLEDLD